MGRFRFVIPNLLTSANVLMGMLSILMAAEGRFDLSVHLLVAAVVLDMSDGPSARLLNATSRFGQQMDSLSDCVSFCAAPALLVYWAVLDELGWLGAAVAFLYLIAGVLRLARFNVSEDAHSKSHRSMGLPTPLGAGYLMAVALMRDDIAAWGALAVVLAMVALMVSRAPLPTLKGKATVVTTLIGLGTFVVVVVRPSWTTVLIWQGWCCVMFVVATWETRRAEAADAATLAAA